jgi:hypothetical protein
MINWKHGWVIKGGQKYFTTHNEKSARDKNCEIKKRKTIEVGHPQYVRKDATSSTKESSASSSWFLDETREIPPNQSWFG